MAKLPVYSFNNLKRFFFSSFAFSVIGNLAVSILTYLYVFVYRVGSELNPVMNSEKVLGVWLFPAHVVSVSAYYLLFYFTIKYYLMTSSRFRLWIIVLTLIPVLTAFDLAFDMWSIIRIS